MEENQYIQKVIAFIKNNKYNVYFISAIAAIVFLIIIVGSLMFNYSSKKNQPNNISTVSQIPSQNTVSQTISPTVIVMTPNPTQAAVIENQTQEQIAPQVSVPYTVSNIINYGDNWAIIGITNPSAGGAVAIAKKVDGSWKIVLGPGSFFSTQQLQSLGAPQELINSFMPPSSAVSPISISPSQEQSHDPQ